MVRITAYDPPKRHHPRPPAVPLLERYCQDCGDLIPKTKFCSNKIHNKKKYCVDHYRGHHGRLDETENKLPIYVFPSKTPTKIEQLY